MIAYVEHLRDVSFGKAVKASNFGSEDLFKKHFENHGAKLGTNSATEYLEKARVFAGSKNDNIMSVATDEGRRIAKFNPTSGEFLVTAQDGRILTYFKTDNPEQGFLEMINTGKGLQHVSTKKPTLPASLDVSD